MNIESMAAARAARNPDILAGSRRAVAAVAAVAALATLALVPAAALAADPAAPATQSPGVKFEKIAGSTALRVILTAKSAERLGIETAKVSEEAIVRKQMVGGLIIPPMDKQQLDSKPAGSEFGGFGRPSAAAPPAKPGAVPAATPKVGAAAPAPVPGKGAIAVGGGYALPAAAVVPQPAAGQGAQPAASQVPPGGPLWVLVALSPGEWERLAKDKPARLLQLATREKFGTEILAEPSGMPPLEDIKRSMLSVYYTVPGQDHGLAVNNRVRVELQMAGSEDKQKVVPYSAVYYDAKGGAWVYVSPEPLTFERRRVSVERVVGNLAILSDGPPAGTPVVSVGAALLYGAEIFKK